MNVIREDSDAQIADEIDHEIAVIRGGGSIPPWCTIPDQAIFALLLDRERITGKVDLDLRLQVLETLY